MSVGVLADYKLKEIYAPRTLGWWHGTEEKNLWADEPVGISTESRFQTTDSRRRSGSKVYKNATSDEEKKLFFGNSDFFTHTNTPFEK